MTSYQGPSQLRGTDSLQHAGHSRSPIQQSIFQALCCESEASPSSVTSYKRFLFVCIFFNLSFKYLINLSCGQFFCLLCDGFDVRTHFAEPGSQVFFLVFFFTDRELCIHNALPRQVLFSRYKLLLVLKTGNISRIAN